MGINRVVAVLTLLKLLFGMCIVVLILCFYAIYLYKFADSQSALLLVLTFPFAAAAATIYEMLSASSDFGAITLQFLLC